MNLLGRRFKEEIDTFNRSARIKRSQGEGLDRGSQQIGNWFSSELMDGCITVIYIPPIFVATGTASSLGYIELGYGFYIESLGIVHQ
jgi:hypothetical protein